MKTDPKSSKSTFTIGVNALESLDLVAKSTGKSRSWVIGRLLTAYSKHNGDSMEKFHADVLALSAEFRKKKATTEAR